MQEPKPITIVKQAATILPTKYGKFQLSLYQSSVNNQEHVVLTLGDITNKPPLVRIHSQCLTGDALFSLRCDCGEQLAKSMELISAQGSGILLYLDQEGRGIGLLNKIKAYALQDNNFDTVEANHALGFPPDARDYAIAAEMLKDLGVTEIILLTNNPDKSEQLQKSGITIVESRSLEVEPNTFNHQYLITKKEKLRHTLKKI